LGDYMRQELKIFIALVAFMTATVSTTVYAGAVERPVTIQVFGNLNPILYGDTGSGSGSVDYADAFNTGLGGGAEISYRFGRFSALFGAQYQSYDGDTYGGLSFDNYHVIPLYLGGKLHFLPSNSWWDLYVKLDAGAAYTDSLKVNGQPFWDESWVPFFDFGGGAAYTYNGWRVFLELGGQMLGAPDHNAGAISDAEAVWSLPVRFGFGYSF